MKRFRALGVNKWHREAEIVELFCGRGNGLRALNLLGFTRVEWLDLSARLVGQYRGNAGCYVGDCRQLPFADQSKDALIVQGGLHHLLSLPDDLERTLAQMHRVLRKDGRVLLVEPWLTPFLRFAHFACERPTARRLSGKVDALAVMIQHERQTYEQWLNQPDMILEMVHRHFVPIQQSVAWGKWNFVGQPIEELAVQSISALSNKLRSKIRVKSKNATLGSQVFSNRILFCLMASRPATTLPEPQSTVATASAEPPAYPFPMNMLTIGSVSDHPHATSERI